MRDLLLKMLTSAVIVLFASGAVAEIRQMPSDCTYEVQVWNVNTKSGEEKKKIRHSYHDMRTEEIDPETGCSVCTEDQELISIPPLPSFSLCYKLAPRMRLILGNMARQGAPIRTIIGYHVIRSRGVVDGKGNRTGFSNHSFGTAIDINPERNGLYDDCMTFGPQCRLLRGGEWRSGTPGALDRNGDIVSLFKQAGFQWGGEIAGRQKDFMHFSLSGY